MSPTGELCTPFDKTKKHDPVTNPAGWVVVKYINKFCCWGENSTGYSFKGQKPSGILTPGIFEIWVEVCYDDADTDFTGSLVANVYRSRTV